MENQILWQKYRPKTLDEIILPERIKSLFKDDKITTHYIFVGKAGCGKSSLSKILVKNRSYLKLNASTDGGIDTLRNEVDDFCTKYSIGKKKDDQKIVFLDEMDRTSKDFQEGLRSFIEDERFMENVRFIGTANNLKEIINAQLSRFRVINFNPESQEEEKFLLKEYYLRCKNLVLPNENITMSDDDLKTIVKRNFPDFRSILDDIQYYKETGRLNNPSNANLNIKNELFEIIFNEKDNEKIYHFLVANYGDEKISDMLKTLGRPFFEWCCLNKRDVLPNLLKGMKTVTDYTSILNTSCSDPLILGLSVIGQIKNDLDIK